MLRPGTNVVSCVVHIVLRPAGSNYYFKLSQLSISNCEGTKHFTSYYYSTQIPYYISTFECLHVICLFAVVLLVYLCKYVELNFMKQKFLRSTDS